MRYTLSNMSDTFDRKNVLVTGGAGFIGSHLCDQLIKDSHVICVDNFITSSVSNIKHLLQNSNFEFIHHDIIQPFDIEAIPELERFKIRFQGIQEVYHLACPISKHYFDDFKIANVLTNSVGVKNVLDLAVKYESKVLHASSSVLYGPRQHDRQYFSETEECHVNHLTRRGAYDEGKRFSEAMMETYADVYKLDVKIARIFHTYGPRMRSFDGNTIADMVLNALDNKDIVIVGNEDACTSLTYVTDIVDGLLCLMSTPIDVTLLNLGSSEDIRLVSIAKKILELTASASHVRFESLGDRFIDTCLPDVTRAREVLEWSPIVHLEDGISKMVAYAYSNRHFINS